MPLRTISDTLKARGFVYKLMAYRHPRDRDGLLRLTRWYMVHRRDPLADHAKAARRSGYVPVAFLIMKDRG
ncbi:hypothetical protein [Bradyrhizobium sp. RT10b]|uniref:hypothetical protein n=1 Tax=Bradyrhizobium sp. RT10b TaxID=3156331 RepID=UPI003390B7CC